MKEVQLALALDSVPNSPYFPRAISRAIRNHIKDFSDLQVREDEFAIYAHYSYGHPRNKLVIDTHLDHPSFATNKEGVVIPLGSIAVPEMIERINAHQGTIPVTFYDPNGQAMGKGYLQNLRMKDGGTVMQACVANAPDKRLPPNIQAIPDLPARQDGEMLQMRSADNLSVTAVALEYMQWLIHSKAVADVTFIFTKLEEVMQISATAIAQRGYTPFGRLDDKTYIVVLEAASVGSTPKTQDIPSSRPIDYLSGVLIRISDQELTYQQAEKQNLAEALMLHARDVSQIKTQHGPSVKSCDATSYVLFSDCPHIICLTVPTYNKHNFDADGRLTHESLALHDLNTLFTLLQSATYLVEHEILPHREQILLPERLFPGHNPRNIASKKKAWRGGLTWGTPRLKADYLFSTTLLEYAQFSTAAVRSRLGFMSTF